MDELGKVMLQFSFTVENKLENSLKVKMFTF